MDFSKRTFRNLVNQSNKMIESWYSQKIRGEKIYENKTPSEIKKVFRLEEKNKPVSYTHLRAHETSLHLVCRLLLEKKT